MASYCTKYTAVVIKIVAYFYVGEMIREEGFAFVYFGNKND
jgi:hypothetical protein